MVRITKIIQIKHDTVKSIGSVSFEPCRKSGKLKYSSTVRVYSEDKEEIHTRYITGSPESQQHTGSQIIRICMEIYLKIDKTVKMYKNSY